VRRSSLSRRAILKAAAVGGLAATFPAFGQSSTASGGGKGAVIKYLLALSRPDGGYAWEDQEESHLTPTFAVVGCMHLLGQTPPRKAQLVEFIRTHHPSQLKKLEQEHHEFEFQQIQALRWLGEDASELRGRVRGWKKPAVYMKQYEQHGYPILRHEMMAIICRELLGLPLNGLGEYVDYLGRRRRTNGSFNNTLAADGGEGHVLNTWYAIEALRALGKTGEMKEQTVAWLRACQLPNGGFAYQPRPQFGGVDDVAYTWAAVRALKELGAGPADARGCLAYLHALWNADGGFGDRPGWASNPMSTYYALDALDALGELDAVLPAARAAGRRAASLPANLKVFSIQIEAHGHGSPAEAVDLAGALRIHLWGAKNAAPGWIAIGAGRGGGAGSASGSSGSRNGTFACTGPGVG